MKNIFIIGGTMGVGKTTISLILNKKLNNSVFLDGDWCWYMDPFQVTEETKKMVIENICCLLNNFIKCSIYENILFCWVMHEQAIIDDILARLVIVNCKINLISLVCSEEALKSRLKKDVNDGIRNEDVICRSIDKLRFYDKLNTNKVDVTQISPEQAADLIIKLCNNNY